MTSFQPISTSVSQHHVRVLGCANRTWSVRQLRKDWTAAHEPERPDRSWPGLCTRLHRALGRGAGALALLPDPRTCPIDSAKPGARGNQDYPVSRRAGPGPATVLGSLAILRRSCQWESLRGCLLVSESGRPSVLRICLFREKKAQNPLSPSAGSW